MQVLRDKANRESVGKDSAFTLQHRPLNLERVMRHAVKARLRPVQVSTSAAPNLLVAATVKCRTPPPTLPRQLPMSERWRVPERLFYDVEVLIKSSFEANRWRRNETNGDELIIHSSVKPDQQSFEVQSLHDFLGHLDTGCNAAQAQDFIEAGHHWKDAFIAVEALVKSQYHGIIPNLIQKLNDLHLQGFEDVATKLKTHIANCSRVYLTADSSTLSVYCGFEMLEMEFVGDLEERVMKQYSELFEFYLGHRCFNAFVAKKDSARQRLLRHEWTRLDDCLPSISYLDAEFGASDRRTLEVIGIRAEISSRRGLHRQVCEEASSLIERAEMIQNDEWQRCYHLTRGYYFLGLARYKLEERDEASEVFSKALFYEEELRKVEDYHIFEAERIIIHEYLQDLIVLNGF